MKFDVKVKNLGRIKNANFRIRPITVITGENGTGKSFFTKSFYSILNVMNRNIYYETVNETIRQLQLQVNVFFGALTHPSRLDTETVEQIEINLINLQNNLNEVRDWKISEFISFTKSKVEAVKLIQDYYLLYLNELKSDPKKISSVSDIAQDIEQTFSQLRDQLTNPSKYTHIIKYIQNELKDNFQISSLSELICFNEKNAEISVDGLLQFVMTEGRTSLTLHDDFINDVTKLSSVIFFESPAYWRVRDALKMAKDATNNPLFSARRGKGLEDILVGVPKYFYDLDTALTIPTKSTSVFEDLVTKLENVLGGEFLFKENSLSFKYKQTGQEISKNMVSLGMTNLGMIHALLKHNVITQGSFVFIDEPETNLHPNWQLLLIEVLLELAKKGVNVVITTHSIDILKSIEVKSKAIDVDINDFLSTHFVELSGELLNFTNENSREQLIEARELLSATYEQLYFDDI